jgi:hypothetical protein
MNRCACGNSINGDGTLCLRCIALQELGLKSGATDTDVRAAYLLYVKAWHPDRFPGDEKSKSAAQEKLKAINFAYSYLNYLSANAQNYISKPAPAPIDTKEPVQTSQTTAGKPAQAQQPSPRSNSSGYTSPKSTRSTTLFSKFPVARRWAARRWGYLFYLIPLILWVGGEFNKNPSNRGPSPTASKEAISPAVPRPPSGLTPVPLEPNDFELMPAVRLLSGTELRKRRHLNGLGELSIENGTSFDAVVHLVDLKTEKTIRTFYVQQGDTFTERQIAPGLYGIYFATGDWWNPESKKFNSAASYSQFGRNIEYSERRDPDAGRVGYDTYKITLQPVVGGNVTTYPSDKDDFDKMMNDPTKD